METPAPSPRTIKRYGWIPDLPDQRDHIYAAPPELVAALPASVDLRSQCPTVVYDQGQLGSCTANAIAGAVEFGLLKQRLADFMPSRLFIYYNERVIEGTVQSDSGAMLRDGIKTVAKQGVCPETLWAYDTAAFAEAPPAACYQEAVDNRVLSYQRVPQTLTSLKVCLAHGYPIAFGFQVYESFESAEVARTGEVPLPATTEGLLGGHAVLAVGYDDATTRFLVRNSWGPNWGQGGYFTMPYPYLTERNLSSDFWAVLQVA
jgi:C1A family cysteine protease